MQKIAWKKLRCIDAAIVFFPIFEPAKNDYQLLNQTDMKKHQLSSITNRLLLFSMFVIFGQMAVAQEANNQEYKLTVGDTIVWQPFNKCDMISYNRSGGKIIDFKLLKFGEQVQVIALKEGNCSIKATCGDVEALAQFTVQAPYVAPVFERIEKPETQAFTATYAFNPPRDYFFITIRNQASGFNETYVKHGDNEAFNDGQGLDRFWNIKSGKNWYYRPDAQGWTDDVDWEFQPFGESFFPLNAFANEVDQSDLSQYYIGTDKVLDVDCWVFFVEQQDGSVIRYWVDPANGCTLKRQINNDGPYVVTVYDLKYTRLYFGPSFKKSLHDTTR